MRILRILTKKEFLNYFLSPFGWVVIAYVILMQGLSLSSAMKGFVDSPVKDSLIYVAFHTPIFWFSYIFIFPLVTMRLFAEEERTGTLETLLTAPVHTWQVVFSKYLAAFSFYCLLWVPVYFQFQTFSWITNIPPAFSPGSMIGVFALLWLMGLAFVAIGCFASALTSSQIFAGIITIMILVMLYFLGFVTVIWGESFLGADLFKYISSQFHLHHFSNGLIDTRPLVYYFSLTSIFLFLTYQVIDLRRWRP